MKAHKGLLHNGEELHNGFTQPKTQYIFFNVLYDVFLFLLLIVVSFSTFLLYM